MTLTVILHLNFKIMFSSRSKPKVINFSTMKMHSDVESFNVKTLSNTEIIKLNPDLIITGKGDTDTYDQLCELPLILRKRWVLAEQINENQVYSIAVYNSLLPQSDMISIFTSAYKRMDYIKRAYKSLCAQTYSNWEWVIVDDTPDPNLIYPALRSLAKQDARVKVYQLRDEASNGCIGEAKYRASMLCNGVVSVELDHDDILTEDALEIIMDAYHKHPECGFYYSDCVECDFKTGYSFTYGDDFALGYGVHYPYDYKGITYYPSKPAPTTARSLMHIVGVPNHVRAWKTEILKALGYNRRMRIADDYELILRTFLRTKFCYIPKMIYLQSMGDGNSQDSSDNRDDIQRRVRIISNYYLSAIQDRCEELCGERPFVGWDADSICMDRSNLPILNETYSI